MKDKMLIIDGLQYVNWTRALFEEAQRGGVNAIHVTTAYWENSEEALANIADWERRFRHAGPDRGGAYCKRHR